MKKQFTIFFLLSAIIGGLSNTFAQTTCSPHLNYERKQQIKNDVQQTNSDSIIFKTFETGNGWGYDIYIKNKKYIHQQSIPAVSGNKGFSNKADAEKTAELVIMKIKKNIRPPSVTPKELDSLGILK